MKTYGVVMAGGGGTRLWPLSTKKMPKQFLNLSGKETLVNEAVDRLLALPARKIFLLSPMLLRRKSCFPRLRGVYGRIISLRNRRHGTRRPVSVMRL